MKVHGIQTADELIKRSTEDIGWFWDAAVKHLGIEFFHPYGLVMDEGGGISNTKWFLGGKINIVHNCLDRHDTDSKAFRVALRFETDDGAVEAVTYRELNNKVNELAWSLKQAGVKKGDRIAMCMPISIEAVVIMLATLKLGAVSLQLSCRISPQELTIYLRDASPKILFITDRHQRGGKTFYSNLLCQELTSQNIPIECIVILEKLDSGLALRKGCKSWNNFTADNSGHSAETAPLDSEAPSLILYSSGTTGKSKAVIHTQAGALVQAAKEVGYLFDCSPDDTFFWFTDIGWMMAPWEIIGTLFFGATLVLYEGTPFYPTPHRIFEIIERHRISIFGFVPTALRTLSSSGLDFSEHDLSTLRILGSTGEPLDEKTWEWYSQIFGKNQCPIINFSGGTELLGGLVGSLPIAEQKPGAVGGPGLGMAVDVVNDEGQPVRNQVGYLVCRKPFPSMTRGFLNNFEGFMDTYFSRMGGLWFHGDLAEIDSYGFWFLRGRADDLIVRGGVKYDPAKIEATLISFPGEPKISESAAIASPDNSGGQRIICFVAINNQNFTDDEQIKRYLEELKKHIGITYDPMARPDEIHIIKALPKNLAGKIPRELLRRAYNGGPVGDLSKIENSEVIDDIIRVGKIYFKMPI